MFTKEDYVSLETAKMLKDKGFDEPTAGFYGSKRGLCIGGSLLYNSINKEVNFVDDSFRVVFESCIAAPTLYEAQKWLTQIHSLYVNTICYKKHEWDWIILSVHEGRFASTYKMPTSDALYDTFQQALDAGIQEALKLI